MTKINIQLGAKINTGNFSNIEVHVGIEDEVRQDEKVQGAIDRIFSVVERNLVAKAKEYEKDMAE